MKKRALIVGGGLVGSVLSELLAEECELTLIDQSAGATSSAVAAGMYNPVTGRRLNFSWNIELLNPFALSFYKALEEHKGELLQEFDMYRLFLNEDHKKEWQEKLDMGALDRIQAEWVSEEEVPKGLEKGLGGLKTRTAWRLFTRKFIARVHRRRAARNELLSTGFDYNKLKAKDGGQIYDGEAFDAVVFCEGHEVENNPWFSWLPLKPNKGELLRIKAPTLKLDEVILKKAFIVPDGDNHFLLGATYQNHQVNFERTEEAKSTLLERLDKIINVPFEVVEHRVGIRPASKDRRPICGEHPTQKGLYVLNGLGSKGVSQAPWTASQLKALILEGQELPDDIDICRFPEYKKAANEEPNSP